MLLISIGISQSEELWGRCKELRFRVGEYHALGGTPVGFEAIDQTR